MISAKIDRPKLENSLKKFSKSFGDSNAQALARWSVNSCRELAGETQVYGTSGTKKKQENAILADSYNVLLVVESLSSSGKSFKVKNQGKTYYAPANRVLNSADDVNEWIEINRTRRGGRTAQLPTVQKMICDSAIHKKAMSIRYAKAGMAKGGWIGAGQDIARSQKGQERVNIGKNFLSYAQKHSRFGSASPARSGFKPFVNITNRAKHSSDKNVLSGSAPAKAFAFSLKKTIKWYSMALKRNNKK